MSYFNRTLEWEAFTGITARKAILQFASDPEMAAAFMPTYLSGVEEYVRYALGGSRPGNTGEKTYMPIPLNWLFGSFGALWRAEEPAGRHEEKEAGICTVCFSVVWG